MKRTIVLLATLLLSFGLISAGDVVYVEHAGDTIWTGVSQTFDVSLENDAKLGGMSLGLMIYSPDGATWTWENVGTHGAANNHADSLYVTEVAGSRMVGAWDMTGLLVTNALDGVTPDTLLAGGVALNAGLPAGGKELMYLYHGVVGPNEAAVHTLCVDSILVGTAGNFVFVDEIGGAYTPDFVGGCWPVKKQPNLCPEFAGTVGAANVDHCGSASVGFSASDFEADAIQFSLQSTTGAGTAVVTDNGDGTGAVAYTPAAGEAGSVDVLVYAADAFNGDCATFTATFTITNNAPTIDCGLDLKIGKGGLFEKNDFTSGDVDACDVLVYAIVSQDVATVNAPSFDGSTFSWQTDNTEGELTVEFCVSVFDGFETAECCFLVEVLATEPYSLTIECLEDVVQGHFTDIEITIGSGSEAMGGFDLLIAYDPSGLTFTEAILGADFSAAGWEFFTYRYGVHGNCGNGCPSGNIRLVGMAETNNGPYHPDYDAIVAAQAGSVLATLSFYVTSDVNFGGQCLPINFLWFDCGDNTISVASGDTLAIADLVFPAGANTADPSQAFPASAAVLPGWWGAPVSCEVSDKTEPVRYITLQQGCLCIVHPHDIDDRGDINMNGVLNEIADAVMFTNYFISGLSAFGNHVDGSIAASDVNADGTSLSVADLVYLVRVIIGDASPYPKPILGSSMDVTAQMVNGDLVVNYDATVDAGAALLVFNITGDAGTPIVGDGASNMDIVYGMDNNQLRVLVYNIGSNAITVGQHTLVTIPVQNAELVSVEVADYNGATMEATFSTLPSAFGLMQNYPNPFNPKTRIALNLPSASEWNIQVFNIAGQLVKDYSGNSDAGVVEVIWNGTNSNGTQVASGIYFYKATANNFSATKKMVLMK